MTNEIITLKSGAQLSVGLAPFSDAMRLFKAVANELRQVNIDLDSDAMKNIMEKEIAGDTLNVLKNALCQLIASDTVESALLTCASRSLYKGVKVTRESFEPEESRGDYLVVAWEVMKANLSPFFKSLDLSSLTSASPTRSDQK